MKLINLFVITILLIGCASQESTPENLLADSVFINVVCNIHLAESSINRKYVSNDSAAHILQRYYADIYDKYGVTEEEVLFTYDYYMARPEELELIYQRVIEELTKMQSAVISGKKPNLKSDLTNDE